jgi:hypothetical protein
MRQVAVDRLIVFAKTTTLVADALLHGLAACFGRLGILLTLFEFDHHAGTGDQLFEPVYGTVDIFVVSYFNTDHIFGDIS